MKAIFAPTLIAAALAQAHPAQSAPAPAPRPAEVLGRSVRLLAGRPDDLGALLAAGRSAVELGDIASGAGFFARALKVDPGNPSGHRGMGQLLLALNQPRAALAEFDRAQRFGAPESTVAVDRGLALDLLGDLAAAQAQYRMVRSGEDRDEARRRLALSVAIGGDRDSALAELKPLLERDDPAAERVRAFILALGGDVAASKAALDEALPLRQAGAAAEPFLRRLQLLDAGEKAAALNLGIFPVRIAIPAEELRFTADATLDAFALDASAGPPAMPMEYGARTAGAARRQSVNSPSPLALYGVFDQ